MIKFSLQFTKTKISYKYFNKDNKRKIVNILFIVKSIFKTPFKNKLFERLFFQKWIFKNQWKSYGDEVLGLRVWLFIVLTEWVFLPSVFWMRTEARDSFQNQDSSMDLMYL